MKTLIFSLARRIPSLRAFSAFALSVGLTGGLTGGLIGCPVDPPAPKGDTTKTKTEAPAPTKATSHDANAPSEGIHWHHDDYAAALRDAKATSRPLVVDLWAPWCHTCMSMKHFVLTDPSLVKRKSAFVWLSIDTDKPANAAAIRKLPISSWPTFYVVNPQDESIRARQVGAASLKQFHAFLDQGRKITKTGADVEKTPLSLLQEADRQSAAGHRPQAAKLYQEALKLGGPTWERRFVVRVSLIETLYRLKDMNACVQFASTHLDDQALAKSASAADFTYFAMICDQAAPKNAQTAALWKKITSKQNPIHKVLADPGADLSVDDRSDANRILRDIADKQGDKVQAKKYAERQRKVLDDAVAQLKDPAAIATFAWPREEVYLYLGLGEKLLPALRASVTALTGHYDPPYRLAWLENKLGHFDAALTAAEQSMKVAYGPRQVRVAALIADIQHGRKNSAAEKLAWQEVIKRIQALPEDQQSRQERSLKQAKEKLTSL